MNNNRVYRPQETRPSFGPYNRANKEAEEKQSKDFKKMGEAVKNFKSLETFVIDFGK